VESDGHELRQRGLERVNERLDLGGIDFLFASIHRHRPRTHAITAARSTPRRQHEHADDKHEQQQVGRSSQAIIARVVPRVRRVLTSRGIRFRRVVVGFQLTAGFFAAVEIHGHRSLI
jgi:hypothetical protein